MPRRKTCRKLVVAWRLTAATRQRFRLAAALLSVVHGRRMTFDAVLRLALRNYVIALSRTMRRRGLDPTPLLASRGVQSPAAREVDYAALGREKPTQVFE